MFDDDFERHEIPSQLGMVDKLQLGPIQVSFRQAGCLGLGAASAYSALMSALALPLTLRLVAAVACLVGGVLLAWYRPGGRPVEQWLFVVARYALLPRSSVWRPREPRLEEWRLPRRSGWAEAAPRLRQAPGEEGAWPALRRSAEGEWRGEEA